MSVRVVEAIPSRWMLNWTTVRVLAGRDVIRFFRQRFRVIGALAQPVEFWFLLGSGFGGSFRLRGAAGVGYMQFFFPGVVAMVLLFSTIFATITVIEDRREGFLQCVLAGPGSRLSVVIGKSAGSTLIALLQAGLFLLLAPLAGVRLSVVDWPLLHAVMSLLLIPAWVLSGAMFPIESAGPVLGAVMRLNPMRFSVEGIRRALFASSWTIDGGGSAARDVLALLLFASVTVGISAWRVSRRE